MSPSTSCKDRLIFLASSCSVIYLREETVLNYLGVYASRRCTRVDVSRSSMNIEEVETAETCNGQIDDSAGIDATCQSLLSVMSILLKARVQLWRFLNHESTFLRKMIYNDDTFMLTKTIIEVNRDLKAATAMRGTSMMQEFIQSSKDCETIMAYIAAIDSMIVSLLTRISVLQTFRLERGEPVHLRDDRCLPWYPRASIGRVRGQLMCELKLNSIPGDFTIPAHSFIEVFVYGSTRRLVAYISHHDNTCWILRLRDFEIIGDMTTPVFLRTPPALHDKSLSNILDAMSLLSTSSIIQPLASTPKQLSKQLNSKPQNDNSHKALQPLIDEFDQRASNMTFHQDSLNNYSFTSKEETDALHRLYATLTFTLLPEERSFMRDSIFDNLRTRGELVHQRFMNSVPWLVLKFNPSLVIDTIKSFGTLPPNLCSKLPSFKEIRSKEALLADTIFDMINESGYPTASILNYLKRLFAEIDIRYLDILATKVTLSLSSLVDCQSSILISSLRDVLHADFQNSYQQLIDMIAASFANVKQTWPSVATLVDQSVEYFLLIRLSTPLCYFDYLSIGSMVKFDSSLFEPIDAVIPNGGCGTMVLPPMLTESRDERSSEASYTLVVKGRAMTFDSDQILIYEQL